MFTSYIQVRSMFTTSVNKLKKVVKLTSRSNITFETGKYAKLADSCVVASLRNTSVLVATVNSKPSHLDPEASFVPLSVDYRQKYAAAGRIPTNYLKREFGPTEMEILTGRLIDRSLRPLFPSTYLYDTNLTCQLLAVDGMQEPDVVAINAASASLALSSIPWEGPVGAVRVGVIDDEPVIFPSRKEIERSSLNLVVTALKDGHIVMLEGGGMPVSIVNLKKALILAIEECDEIIKTISKLVELVSPVKANYVKPEQPPEELIESLRNDCEEKLTKIYRTFSLSKFERYDAVISLQSQLLEEYRNKDSSLKPPIFNCAFSKISKSAFRNLVLDTGIRCDGRGLTDIRPLSSSVDLFEPLHGSALFERGQTQVQCTVAFDAPDKLTKVDPLLCATGGLYDRNFLLHYSFPQFAVNELPRKGPLSRREVGHGALASKAIRPLLPKENNFTTLLTSTVLESSGSSSMATVCGGSLALMDAGVQLPEHVAGVAVGLISRNDNWSSVGNYKILTDILGLEDYIGDMDLKMACTSSGMTAIQADIKLIKGVPLNILLSAMDAGVDGAHRIAQHMNETIDKPRAPKANRPALVTRTVKPQQRGAIVGIGGIKLREIESKTGTELSWLDDSTLLVFAPQQTALAEAVEMIDGLLCVEPELQFGTIYNASVEAVKDTGVLVSLYPGMKPAIVHKSQLDVRQVHHPSVLGIKVGDKIKVKYFGRDPGSGVMRLSRRALLSTVPMRKDFLREDTS